MLSYFITLSSNKRNTPFLKANLLSVAPINYIEERRRIIGIKIKSSKNIKSSGRV